MDLVNLADLFLHHVRSHLSVPSFQTDREDQPRLGLLFVLSVLKVLDIHPYPKVINYDSEFQFYVFSQKRFVLRTI